MCKSYYLAIDIGASSGRHIVGWRENGEIQTDEVYRFPNGVEQSDGRLTWNMERLLADVKTGIASAKAKYPKIESLSIDTWAVDYVLLRGNEPVFPCYAYRDSRTEAVIPQVHGIVPFEELYARTGIQFQPFNTIYQLYADKLAGRLDGVTDFLMIPEYLMYRLTGSKAHEYTNATATGLVSAVTGEFDRELIKKLGLLPALFGQLSQPGTVIGEYEGIRVVLCATHDTASAVEGIPMEGNHPYISSGIWSLLGVKTMSYAAFNKEKCIPLMDNGHYHPTEVVSDKIPALLAFFPEIALHVTRPIRWDSDHVVLFDDETKEICREIVRCGAERVNIALDYFDASINRLAAWATGFRNLQKSLLFALLQPNDELKALQDADDWTKLMVMQEELKTLPFGEIWDEYCRQCNVPVDGEWYGTVKDYEKKILEVRK